MSAEWWAPPCDLRVRLAACGHVVFERDVSTPNNVDGLMKFRCPICRFEQSTLTNLRDGVPCENLTWGEARCLKRRDISSRPRSQGRIQWLEDLLASMSTPATVRVNLKAKTLRLGQGLLQEGPAEGLVLRAWPAGCTVTGGFLQLPPSAVMLLTGTGVLFKGTRFSGGLIVCCGADFSGTFHDCEFNRCTLYAVHGASVTLRRCRIRDAFHGAIANGPGTTLHLDTCTLTDSISDVSVESGGAVSAHKSRFTGSISSCMARGDSSHMSFSECCIAGPHPGGRAGVEAQFSRVLLRGCSIERFVIGVVARGTSAAIEVHECHITALELAVGALHGAAAMIRGSYMHVALPQRTRDSMANTPGAFATMVQADGCGAAVQVERCSLSAPECHDVGVRVRERGAVAMVLSDVVAGGLGVSVRENGKRASLSHCSVRSERERACFADAVGGVIRVKGGCVAGAMAAAVCLDGGAVSVRDAVVCGVTGPRGRAPCLIEARQNGTARLRCCSVQHAEQGVLVFGGAVFASDVVISDLEIPASKAASSFCTTGYTHSGGTLVVLRGAVNGCAMGANISQNVHDGSPANASFDRVSFTSNGVGVHVQKGAGCKVTVTGCDLNGGGVNRVLVPERDKQMAVWVDSGNHEVSVRGSTFTGHDDDVYCDENSIEVVGCSFQGCRNKGQGRSVVSFGSGTVRDCVFAGAFCGVVSNGARMAVQSCSFGADVDQGCAIMKAGEASIRQCSFVGCKKSVLAVYGAKVDIADTECTDAEVALEVSSAASVRAARLSVTGGTDGVRIHAERGWMSHVALSDCAIKGVVHGGVWLKTAQTAVSMQRCRIEGSDVGLSVIAGSSAVLRDTSFTRCGAAVTAGMPEWMMNHECRDCGRGGAAAKALAWRTLRAVGAAGAADARCAHDGAVARTHLEGVEVTDCCRGIQVSAAGSVTARRVRVSGAELAFCVTRFGDPSVFENCVARGQSAHLVVVGVMLGPEQGYRFVPEEVAGVEILPGPAHVIGGGCRRGRGGCYA